MSMFLEEELNYIEKLNNFQLVQYFQDGVVARATGGCFEDALYKKIRLKLLDDPLVRDMLPEWIKTKRTIDQFWTFIKGRCGTYQERREFLWDEFAEVSNRYCIYI